MVPGTDRRGVWLAAALLVVLVTVSGCSSDSNVPPQGASPPRPAASGLSPIVATPSTLLFTSLGSGSAQTITLSEIGYSGAFSLRTACTIVTAAVLTQSSYSITPNASGSCTLTFFDANGQTLNVPVTVTAGATPSPAPSANPGTNPIVASPVSLTFLGTGTSLAQTLTLSEPAYSGGFTLNAGCAQAGVTQTTPTTFSVAPVSNGSCAIVIGDNHGQSILVPIVVTVTNGSGQ